jgi:hypothetical protein
LNICASSKNWANTISNPEVVRVLAGHADLKTTMQYYYSVKFDLIVWKGGSFKHSLGMDSPVFIPSGLRRAGFTIPKPFGFEAATQPWE